jgi:Protein of unknown function (DUF2846)
MTRNGRGDRLVRRLTATVLLLALASVAPARAMAEAPGVAPVPPGAARIWFYRDWLPSESLNLANIDVNGQYVGSVANGGSFYRDVLPGHYHIVPQSYNHDFNQDANVDLAPGEQVYIKILSLQSWDGACRDCARDTFYAWHVAPPAPSPVVARAAN